MRPSPVDASSDRQQGPGGAHRLEAPIAEYISLDAICERLKPSLCTEFTYIVREGDPIDEMLLIIWGRLESSATNGGRMGFYNYGLLKEGDFCGKELLTWALDPKASANFPLSTRTVRTISNVEAFALRFEELKFIIGQFWRLHNKQLQQMTVGDRAAVIVFLDFVNVCDYQMSVVIFVNVL
ncbi:putative cyclic nucleotide-gated ion channel 8 [Phragmites australis]|uniref:putative cyclic nucleotide-gated ion channel 8 n=1 Tax=Phragmites australis TaxID=29695 RepID=UPI002D78563C|nr:putative cyclic nucleotide-gated ion channel 8 [Phragmites australis]